MTLAHLKAHPAVMDAGRIRNNLILRARVTVDWPFLHALTVERSPGLARNLSGVDGLTTAR